MRARSIGALTGGGPLRSTFCGRMGAECGGRCTGRRRGGGRGKLADLIGEDGGGCSPRGGVRGRWSGYGDHWLEHVVEPRLQSVDGVKLPGDPASAHRADSGSVMLRTLTPAHVRELLSAKRASGLSARSVQIIHGTLRTMLGEAMCEELIGRNVATAGPWTCASPGRGQAVVVQRRRACSWPLRRRIACTRCSPLGSRLGLRKGELLALRWEDVDLENGLFTCAATCSGSRRAWFLDRRSRPSLAGRSRFRRTSIRILRAHRAEQAGGAVGLGPGWSDTGLVFTSTVGR